MKKLEEVQKRFVDVLKDKFYNKEIPPNLNFNQYLDIGTAILSGLLQHLLEKNDWEKDNWIDDILIRDIKVLPNKLSILGNIIYGKSGTTNEWVTPLLFEISLKADWTDFIAYKCFLGIDKEEELEYVIYNKKRDEKDKYFNQHFYRPKDNWEYVILVNKS